MKICAGAGTKSPSPSQAWQTAREARDPLAMSSGPSHFVVMATGQIEGAKFEIEGHPSHRRHRDDTLHTLAGRSESTVYSRPALSVLCAAWPWDG